MPERIIPIIDSIFMTFASIGLFIMSASLLTIVPTVLAGLFWIGKIKREVEKNHNGNILEWFKYLVKKNG